MGGIPIQGMPPKVMVSCLDWNREGRAMRVRLRYFAAVREAAGGREGEEIDLPAGTDVAAVRALLAERHPALARVLPRCAAAVNRAYVAPETALRDGDELVFIPPVGGG